MTAHFDHDAGPAPCDDCELAERCAARLLACESFRRYSRLERWQAAPREPSAELYAAIYAARQVDEAVLRRLREVRLATAAARGRRNGRKPRGMMQVASSQGIESSEKISATARNHQNRPGGFDLAPTEAVAVC